MKHQLPLTIAVAALLAVLVTPAASAQDATGSGEMPTYTTEGFSVRLYLQGASWSLDDFEEDAEGGGGGGFAVDYGFSNRVAIYLAGSGVAIDPSNGDPYTLGHADLGARFTLGPDESKLKGTLNVALNGRVAELDQPGANVEISGAGLTIGGGLLYFFSPSFALDANLQFTGGEINSIKVNGISFDTPNGIDATSGRLNLGIAWFPGR